LGKKKYCELEDVVTLTPAGPRHHRAGWHPLCNCV